MSAASFCVRQRTSLALLAASLAVATATAATAMPRLEIVANGRARAVVVVSAQAGPWEARAATDLQACVKRMTGATLPLATDAASAPPGIRIRIGRAALDADPGMRTALAALAKPQPVVQADAILLRRRGDELLIAGSNDESVYFAVTWLLQQWGCRWYMPTDFGEVVPKRRTLDVGALDHGYAPPFELRHYWLAWNGDQTGADIFQHRNFMSSARMVGAVQKLGEYTADLAPPGGSALNVPFTDPRTAAHVADRIAPDYAAGRDVSLAMSDGIHLSPVDAPLMSQFDRHMLAPSVTDPMMAFYNNVSGILRRRYPDSRARIGGMAYANATLPPAKVRQIAPNILMWLAPIDIDPNHAMDDPRSPPKIAYAAVMRDWSKLLGGRLAIYDYDQGMLTWRDLPDPSQQMFARDVRLYRDAGVLGFGTESRGAMATVFLNLYFRGQLMWDPAFDVDRALADFYPAFYGPAAAPMARYWGLIFDAWRRTDVTEHEHFAIPAIYTPALVTQLGEALGAAERALAGRLPADASTAEMLRRRMAFTRLGYEIIAGYIDMTIAAASDADYAKAVSAGERALAARLSLAKLNPTFTTHVIGQDAESERDTPSTFAGEVAQMRRLAARTDGATGRLVAKLPLFWDFRIERPLDTATLLALKPPAQPPLAGDDTAAPAWRAVRSDLYLQAQGVRSTEGDGAIGYYSYRTTLELTQADAGRRQHLLFPGLFNTAWLYVNGVLVARRDGYPEPWWTGDYNFEWDVDLTAKLKPGRNVIRLVGYNPHHFAGMFRRPFVYEPRAAGTAAR